MSKVKIKSRGQECPRYMTISDFRNLDPQPTRN